MQSTPDASSPAPVPDPHFAPAVAAFTEALGGRVVPSGPGFADLFTEDAVLRVPFDGDGDGAPVVGRAALSALVGALHDILQFHQVRFRSVLDVDATTVVCEYEALLERFDLGQRFRRRYVGVVVLRGGRIAELREYGGPFMSTSADHLEP